MKKTVELTVTRKEQVTLEVEFPIYIKHDIMPDEGASIYYHRLDADMRRVTVHYSSYCRGSTYELEINPKSGLDGSSEDYSLGRGEYACTAEEFNKALADAIKFAESMK